LNGNRDDIQVEFIDIKEWESPVAKQYGITSVPYFKIYDGDGKLITEGGREGFQWFGEHHPELTPRWPSPASSQ
jgi:hypothetical protein